MTMAELRYWRTRRGLSQRQAAAWVGVAYQTWQSWELGRRKPHRLMLASIARRLGEWRPEPTEDKHD